VDEAISPVSYGSGPDSDAQRQAVQSRWYSSSRFSYRVLDTPHEVEVWTLIQAGDPEYKQDSVAAVAIVGRLNVGVTLNQARSEIALLQRENDRRYPDIPKSTALLDGLQ
jgi:hypothetical protein